MEGNNCNKTIFIFILSGHVEWRVARFACPDGADTHTLTKPGRDARFTGVKLKLNLQVIDMPGTRGM